MKRTPKFGCGVWENARREIIGRGSAIKGGEEGIRRGSGKERRGNVGEVGMEMRETEREGMEGIGHWSTASEYSSALF